MTPELVLMNKKKIHICGCSLILVYFLRHKKTHFLILWHYPGNTCICNKFFYNREYILVYTSIWQANYLAGPTSNMQNISGSPTWWKKNFGWLLEMPYWTIFLVLFYFKIFHFEPKNIVKISYIPRLYHTLNNT